MKKFKNHFSLSLSIFVLALAFISCNNFVSGADLKQQLDEAVKYANSPVFTVRISPEDPAHGIVVSGAVKEGIRVTDKMDLEFSPAAEYTFLGWDAVKKDDHSVSYNDYVVFSEPKSRSTSVQIVKGNEDIYNGQLQLRPLCRPIEKGIINITSTYGAVSYNSEAEYKEGTLLRLSITPNPGYGFTHWIVSIGDQIDTTGDYVKIENPKNMVTDATFLRRPENNAIIYIIPVCVDRPAVISSTPLPSDQGVCRDSRIKVVFDSRMDERSIYYTEPELIAIGAVDEYLKSDDDNTKTYGYVKNGKKYYKNIEIRDRNSGDSLLDYFGEPKFNTPDMLVIPTAAKTDLQVYTEILVTISSNFFTTTEDGYPVSLDGKTIWNYLVNDQKDTEPPKWGPLTVEAMEGVFKNRAGTEFSTFDWNRTTWSQMTGETGALYYSDITANTSSYKYYVRNNTIKVNAEFTDDGTGPSRISIDIDRVKDNDYEDATVKTLPVRVVNNKGLFQRNSEGSSNPEGIEVELKDQDGNDLPDGAYRLKFIAEDEAGKTADSKYYYIILDNTNEEISMPSDSSITTNSISFNDMELATSSYYFFYQMKKAGEQEYGTLKRLINGSESITGLTAGTSYNFQFFLCDEFGNRNQITKFTRNTLPATPVNVTALPSTTSNKAAVITWTKGDNAHYTGARITVERYSPETGNTSSTHVDEEKTVAAIDNQNDYSYEYKNLLPGYRYVFKVSSYDSGDDYDTPNYSNSQTAASGNLVLAPDPVSGFTVTDNYNGSVLLKWSKTPGYINGYYYSYKKVSDSSDQWSTPALIYGSDLTQQSVNLPDGMTGKDCIFKLQSVVVNSTNHNTKYAESSDIPQYTFFIPPKNLENFAVDSYTNKSITLKWELPQTDYDGIRIGYKKDGEANYTFINGVAKNSTNCTIYSLSNSSAYSLCYYTYKNNGNATVTCQTAGITHVTRPNEIKNFAASSENGTQIKFAWTKPQGTYSGIKIWTKKTTDSDYSLLTTIAGTTASEYTWNLGSSAFVYDVKAAAYYDGETNISTESLINASTAVDPVTDLNVGYSYSESIYIRWTKPNTHYDAFILSYKTGNNTPTTIQIAKNTTSYTINNLAIGTCYDITVSTKATKTAGEYNKEYTNEQSILGYTRPDIPSWRSFKVTSKTQDNISLSWEPPEQGSVSGYIVTKKDRTINESKETNAAIVTDTSANIAVTPGHLYDFYVYAYLGEQSNKSSYQSLSKVYAKPPACAFEVNPYTSEWQKVSWTWPEAGRADMWLYIYYSTSSNFTNASLVNYSAIEESDLLYRNITSLTPVTKYYWWIATYVGSKALSGPKASEILSKEDATVSECIALQTAPNPPKDLRITMSDGMGRIKLKWQNPDSYDSLKVLINNHYYNCSGTESGWIDIEDYNYNGESTEINLYAYNTDGIASSPSTCYLNEYSWRPGNLIINETEIEYTNLIPVNTDSQKTVAKSSSLPGTSVFYTDSADAGNDNVQIPVYSIGAYEVRDALFYFVMGYSPSHWQKVPSQDDEDRGEMPVDSATLCEALLFCNKLSALFGYTPYYKVLLSVNGSDQWCTGTEQNSPWITGSSSPKPSDFAVNDADSQGFRLPSRVMWEFAARGGNPDNSRDWNSYYAGARSGDYPKNSESEFRNKVANNKDSGFARPKRVCFTPNGISQTSHPLGLYNMSGNVSELTDTTTPDKKVYAVGGSFNDTTGCGVASYKNVQYDKYDAFNSKEEFGFRLCRNKVYETTGNEGNGGNY